MITWQYIVGILLAMTATSIFNLCPVLQKDELDKMKEVSMNNIWASVKMMFSDRKWVLGLILGVFGGIPYTIAVIWTGISVVQPLMNFGFIVLVIIAKKMLNETLSISAKVAIGMMILMPIAITLANVSNPVNDITQLPTQLALVIFVVVVLIIAVITLFLGKKFPTLYALSTGFFFACGAYSVQFVMSMLAFSGYNIFTDIPLVISLIFVDPRVSLILFGVVCIAVFNAVAGYVMQIGLQRVAASKFNPIQQTLNNLATVLGGILVFGQFIGNWAFYLCGLGFGIIGMIILGKYQIPSSATPISPAELQKEK